MFYNTGIGTYVWIVTNRKEKRRKGKIQLLDARAFYVPSPQPRRQAPQDRRAGRRARPDCRDRAALRPVRDSDTSKIFDNADFGYTRVTVERPLRLRYQMTVEDKARFLDACPHLLDDVQAIDKALGREPQLDWNAVWARIEDCCADVSRAGRPPSRSSSAASSRRRTPRPSRGQGGRKGLRARRRPARLREHAAQGRHRRLLRARGAAPCARRLDGPQQGQGGL